MAMIPLAEGKPLVRVAPQNKLIPREESVFVCRQISGLHVASDEWCFRGDCDWIDPPVSRPDNLVKVMEISCGDCLKLGAGWWYDGYFDWYYVFDPALVVKSLRSDHAWVTGFLEAALSHQTGNAKRRKAEPGDATDGGGTMAFPGS